MYQCAKLTGIILSIAKKFAFSIFFDFLRVFNASENELCTFQLSIENVESLPLSTDYTVCEKYFINCTIYEKNCKKTGKIVAPFPGNFRKTAEYEN
jgi:hypothetical protein